MIELTQAHSGEFGSCWQTAIACLLELPAEVLPDQHVIEKAATMRKRAQSTSEPLPEYFAGHYSYQNALNAYLTKHHGLGYQQEPAWKMAALQFREPGWHIALGPTTRNEFYHCVVARYGAPVWDTSPSRAGLSRVDSFGWLVPVAEASRATEGHLWHFLSEGAVKRDLLEWSQRADKAPQISTLCCCPLCFHDGDYR